MSVRKTGPRSEPGSGEERDSDDPKRAELDRVVRLIGDELLRAMERFAPFNSPHEGKAVIEEELDELWEHVKANTGRSREARQEAIQIAAMAARYFLDFGEEQQ